MIKRETLLNLNFYKKAAFTGSCGKFCYRVEKEDDKLKASIWKGPYCSTSTSDQEKSFQHFMYSDEGLCEAAEWLNSYVKEREI